jgi:DNA-directed RNA polymerase specialized sigma24 family protein
MANERRYAMQTGGSERHWMFDPTTVESIGPIMDKLVHYDEYFAEEQGETTLAIVLDKMLDDLPEQYRLPVSLVYLSGCSYRSAGRTLGIDHKTVKMRANKGIDILRERLRDTAWVAAMLDGMIPEQQPVQQVASPERLVNILQSLGKGEE